MSSLLSETEDAAVFGWGDFPVLNDYTAEVFTSSMMCDNITDKQEWSSTPPPYAVASSLRRYSSSSSRHHQFADSSPSLALSLVSSSDDDDDNDAASNYSDESESALTLQKPQGLPAQHVTKTSSNSEQRHVHFAHVTVQEHEVVLGDHPWTGPFPLALGWQRYATREYTLDVYEQERMSGGRRRARSRGELPRRLSAVERCQRLVDVTGCSLASLQQLEKQRQHELENQTYPMPDDNDNDEAASLCFQDKQSQLPADFYTTIVPSHRRKYHGTMHFFYRQQDHR